MKSYLNSKDRNMCSGCRCCEHICPVNAISMEFDNEGFLYPNLDKDKCIHCNLCKNRCPMEYEGTRCEYLDKPIVYAAKNKDLDILKKSSSGGVFSVLAEFVINNGGIVVGCTLDEEFMPKHIIVEDKEDIEKLLGSKYIQSDTLDTFPQIKEALESGKSVLFTGTPCQVAGLNSYLNHTYENLITVDLICHGTPSRLFFQDYLNWLEKKIGGKVIKYKFRDKSKYGWASVGSYTYEKNTVTHVKQLLPESDYYYYFYYVRGDVYRESCYTCKYATIKREGDFSLGDYWGIEKFHPEFYQNNGISMIILNTKKAERIFKSLSLNIDIILSDIEYARKGNGNLNSPSIRPNSRDVIYKEVKDLGFGLAAKRNCKLKIIFPRLKRKIPYGIRKKIKKVILNLNR